MRISIITIHPEFFESPLQVGIVGRGIAAGLLQVDVLDLRVHGLGRHRQLDDSPFGGGPGMVMMIEPLAAALDEVADSHRVLFTPAGRPMTQTVLDGWANRSWVTFVCGRYEGVDERVAENLVDEEVSLGDFVVAGGEVAALAGVEGIARLVPGVIGNPISAERESFRGDGMLEEPQYTRPADFRGLKVPEVLLSGDHGRVEEWREAQREKRTRDRRPDLWDRLAES